LDLKLDLIPVRPAAHYLMGGVRTGIDGHSSLPRLYAAGEAACTGVHGANRLASNSLLEGLVFGARAAKFMLEETEIAPGVDGRDLIAGLHPGALVDAQRTRLQSLMWRHAGLLRDRDGLRSAAAELAEMGERLPSAVERPAIELKNLHTVASLIVQAALGREESRGAHFRNDFPRRDDLHYRKHSVIREGDLSWVAVSSAPAELAERPAGKPQPQSPPSPR
jgi:L-aspartate oxidase